MARATLLPLLALLAGCGPAFEIVHIEMQLAPPALVGPAPAPEGPPVTLGDLRTASGEILIDVPTRSIAFSAAGLPAIDDAAIRQGFAYHLWLVDLSAQGHYAGELVLHEQGRTSRRISDASGRFPLEWIRQAVVVLWAGEDEEAVASANVGKEHDSHVARPGWALLGRAEDLPPGAQPQAAGHSH